MVLAYSIDCLSLGWLGGLIGCGWLGFVWRGGFVDCYNIVPCEWLVGVWVIARWSWVGADVRCARVFRSLAIAVFLVGLVGVVLPDLWVLRL